MGEARTFRDLLIWQRSKALVKDVYALTKNFPKEEIYGLTSQLQRSAVSVPSNIAEGYGRRSNLDFLRFLRMASGSLYELQTQIDIAYDLDYVSQETCQSVLAEANEVEKMISSFVRKMEEKNRS